LEWGRLVHYWLRYGQCMFFFFGCGSESGCVAVCGCGCGCSGSGWVAVDAGALHSHWDGLSDTCDDARCCFDVAVAALLSMFATATATFGSVL
jgi:hypothetical protein